MRKVLLVILGAFIAGLCPLSAFAWDTDVGHPKTTDAATTISENLSKFVSEFELDGKKLVLYDKYDKKLSEKGYDAYLLINKGSKWEDYGPDHKTSNTKKDNRRFFNHYYDGISHEGLFHLDWLKFINIAPKPTLQWAKDGVGVDGPNEWSWEKAREYEFNALTAQDKNVRNENFAKMFRSVGQVAHLLEDMVQPGHVRNDAHVSPTDSGVASSIFNPSRHEEWVKNNGDKISITVNKFNVPGLSSIDDYFNNLALTTNVNFFSDDTVFSNDYASPSKEEADRGDYSFGGGTFNGGEWTFGEIKDKDGNTILDDEGFPVEYIYITWKIGDRKGHKLAVGGYLSDNVCGERRITGGIEAGVCFAIDNAVAEDNANIVLPMAAEYATGLIDYFFRGAMEMNESTYEITNKSSETMDGTFTLYYDDAEDKRTQVPNASWTAKIEPNAAFKPENLVLPEAAKSRPDNIKDKYILVFSGTLGSEPNAVAGKNVTLVNDEPKKKELILYSVGGVYKTYDPETKEVKPYSGIFTGATKRVVWRDDGKAAIAQFGNSWYLINPVTKQKYLLCSSCPLLTDAAWKGENALLAQAVFDKYAPNGYSIYNIHYKELSVDGVQIRTSVIQLIMDTYALVVSGNGGEIALSGWRYVNYSTSYASSSTLNVATKILDGAYVVRIGTDTNTVTYQKVGERKTADTNFKESNGMWYFSNIDTNTQVMRMGYNGAILDVKQSSYEYMTTNSPNNEYSAYDLRLATYVLDVPFNNDTYYRRYVWYRGSDGASYPNHEDLTITFLARELNILKNGDYVIPYKEYYDFYRRKSGTNYTESGHHVTPILYIDGRKVRGITKKVNDALSRFMVANNPSRDKTLVRMHVRGYYYDPITWNAVYLDTMNVLYYWSDAGAVDITGHNPEFISSEFVAYILN